MASRKSRRQELTWQEIVALVGLVIGLAFFVAAISGRQIQLWLAVPSVLAILGFGIYFTRNWIIKSAKRLDPYLIKVNPWLLVPILALSAAIFICVRPVRRNMHIRFYRATCGLFESQDHQKDHTDFIQTYGLEGKPEWTITDEGSSGGFSYKINDAYKVSKKASSGGYITFYGQSCDRLSFETLRFRCRATDSSGTADVGVRLTVDNPKKAGDRELVTYQVKSLKAYGQIDDVWRTFELPLGAFDPNRFEPPFPDGLDANTINKLVFYIDADIADSCQSATLWFRDICFLR